MRTPRASLTVERRGWMLKKAKTDRSWQKAHHSHRYFVSRGHVLSYYERQVHDMSAASSSGLRGVIDLREVKTLRPCTDTTAPAFALDIVLSGRTYVVVPQPATAEELNLWIQNWRHVLRMDVIEPKLLDINEHDASAPMDISEATTNGGGGGGGAATPTAAAASPRGLPAGGDQTASSSSSLSATDGSALLQGFLLKMPLRSKGGSRTSFMSASNLLGDLASWKRRYMVLRRGMIQWYRDDPAGEGEFLGVMRLTPDTAVEFEKDRLRIRTGGESLLLREDNAAGAPKTLALWQQRVAEHVRELVPTLVEAALPNGAAVLDDRDL